MQEILIPLFDRTGSQNLAIIGILLAIMITPFFWQGIERTWKSFRDQARIIFIFQLVAFIIYILLLRENSSDGFFGFLIFIGYNNLVLGMNLLGKIRYTLGIMDDERPIYKGFVAVLIFWSGYNGLGLVFPFLNSKILIFQIFIILQLLGWVFLTKDLERKEIIFNLRTGSKSFDFSKFAIILFVSYFFIFGINSTTLIYTLKQVPNPIYLFTFANIVAGILIIMINLRILRPANWFFLTISLQLFLLSLVSFFFFDQNITAFFSIVSQILLIVFGLMEFQVHNQNSLKKPNLVFSLSLAGIFLGPAIFALSEMDHSTVNIGGFIIYIVSMISLIGSLKRYKENISRIDIKSNKFPDDKLMFNLENPDLLPEKDKELSEIMDTLQQDVKGYVKRDDEKNAILYKAEDLELRIHLKKFHKHHDKLIQQLIATIQQFEKDNTAQGNTFFHPEEIEALKNRIKDDIAKLSYGKGPRFII